MSSGTLQRATGNGLTAIEDDDGIELVAPPAIGVARLEIDSQVATAHQYPRSVARSISNATAHATLNPEIAASCTYALPARRGGDGKTIIGPSIRLAEIFASTWGNMRVESRIVDDDGKFVTAEAMCWDLESNLAVKVQKKRRVTTREGRRFGDDMINVTCNAAISIALRDAIFRVIPKTYVEHVRMAAAGVVIGDSETFNARRDKCLAYFASKGISDARVFAALEIKGADDLTPEHFVTLRGIEQSIRAGDITVNDAFPPVSPLAHAEPPQAGESRTVSLAKNLKQNLNEEFKAGAVANRAAVEPAKGDAFEGDAAK